MLHSTNCNLALRAIELDTDLNASTSVILDLCYNVTHLHCTTEYFCKLRFHCTQDAAAAVAWSQTHSVMPQQWVLEISIFIVAIQLLLKESLVAIALVQPASAF